MYVELGGLGWPVCGVISKATCQRQNGVGKKKINHNFATKLVPKYNRRKINTLALCAVARDLRFPLLSQQPGGGGGPWLLDMHLHLQGIRRICSEPDNNYGCCFIKSPPTLSLLVLAVLYLQ